MSEELKGPSKATLAVQFSGTMNNVMAGFYRSKYKPAAPAAPSVPRDDEFHYMFSTQFESCDARRAFPCFDEPNLKASFDFEIEIPEDQTALSNMPEKEVKPGSRSGLKKVSFERSPRMSTYVCGDVQEDRARIADDSHSCWLGHLVTLNMSRAIRREGTTGRTCPCGSTRRGV